MPADDRNFDCPACGVSRCGTVFPRARGPASVHVLVRCEACGLVFMRAGSSPEQIRTAQMDLYGEPTKKFNPIVEFVVRRLRMVRVRAATKLMPPGGSILDIGCGRGLFLHLLQARGYRVRGTELDELSARHVHADVPLDLGDVEPGRYPPESFDLISIWHVLEHLPRPALALTACHRALKADGALVIAVPNFASWQARCGGEWWFHLDLPRHIHHFTPASLIHLLETSGFDVERQTTGQWEMDPFGLLQTILNRMRFRFNGLYDTLRSNPSASRDLTVVSRAGFLLCFAVGLPFALCFSALARVMGRGGTIRLVARKRRDR